MTLFPQLQSGFIATVHKPFILPTPMEMSVREAVIFKEFKPPLLNYHFSKEVTEIFNRWSAKKEVIGQIDFRERILRTTLECFGNPKFGEWLMIQITSEKLTGMHCKFLLETLAYVMTGTPRAIENMQWINLLEAGEATRAIHINPEDYIRVKNGVRGNVSVSNTFADLIVRWTSQRAGFEDLLVCLYVIFGERSRQSNVNDLSF